VVILSSSPFDLKGIVRGKRTRTYLGRKYSTIAMLSLKRITPRISAKPERLALIVQDLSNLEEDVVRVLVERGLGVGEPAAAHRVLRLGLPALHHRGRVLPT